MVMMILCILITISRRISSVPFTTDQFKSTTDQFKRTCDSMDKLLEIGMFKDFQRDPELSMKKLYLRLINEYENESFLLNALVGPLQS